MALGHLVLYFASATAPHHSKFTMPCPASAQKGKSTQDPKPSSKARGRAKQTSDDDKDTTGDLKAVSCVAWNEQRIEQLVEWLENNVKECQRLFSDSAQDAKEEKCRPHTARSGKTHFHIKMAEYIFSVDESAKIRDDLRENGVAKFAKAVENWIGM